MAATLLLLLLVAEVRAQSALDGFNPFVNGWVRVIVVQPDGKILISGEFIGVAGVARNYLARVNPDGTLDTAFNPNPNGVVLSIVVQADGKILVGGVFSSIAGETRNNIARLDPTTGLADSFDPNANGGIESIVVLADGKILAGGNFTGINGHTRNRIARLDATTGLADSFNPNANNIVYSIALQADGKILAGGNFTSIGGQTRNRIARIDPITGLADSFDPNASHIVRSIAVQADGKVLAGGSFSGPNSMGGQTRNGIARLDGATGLADSFDPDVVGTVYSIAVQSDGRILAVGAIGSVGGEVRNNIARLDPATGLPDSFDPNPNATVYSVAVQADGKILVGGQFNDIGGQQRGHFARLETDGRLDQTLDSNIGGLTGSGFVFATAVQPDGKILIGGRFATVLGVTRNNIARLNADGTLDAAFDPNANADVRTIAVQTDGKILVGGNFFVADGKNSIGGQPRNRIARLDAATGLADSFNPDADAIVLSIAIQADGKILAGGAFQGLGGQTRRFIARLDPATGLADSFNPNPNNPVFSIAVQPDGKILAGGQFASIGGQTRGRIARLDPTTGLADSFDPNAKGLVNSITVQADGKVLAAGEFTVIGGETRRRIARLDATTGLADSFNPDANGTVYSIALQADGKIVTGGVFSSIGGEMRNHIARLDPITGAADSFNPNANAPVDAITIQADGKILVGGSFSGANSVGGQARNFFARLSNDTAAQQNLVVTRTTVTWTRGGSSPQFARVSFEYSTDNMSYTPLGNGTRAGNDWTLAGLNLPTEQNIYIRARGHYGTGAGNNSGSTTESVRNAFIVRTPGTLGNISTRLRVQTGDNAMIGGFIITGTEPKTVIVRGIGPSLPVPGTLADPEIEVYGSSGQLLATNDNWRDGLYAQQVAETLPPSSDLESALYGTINPGAYTVIVRGTNDTTGIAIFEVYDLAPTANSKLANISTRGFVETGDNVLIGGLIVIGQNPLRAIVRAIGPSLPVPGALGDPILELYDANGGLIAVNYNWQDDQEAEILATGIPPSHDLESAIVRDFAPGNYTAIVRGLSNTAGLALIEAYGLN